MPSKQSATKPKRPTKSDVDASEASLSTVREIKSPEKTSSWKPKLVDPVRVEQTLEEAFPDVDPGMKPFGSRVLIQIRTPREVTSGGILLPEDVQDTEKWNTTIAKIIAVGPGAFKNRDTLDVWPEGEWAKAGDFVWCPKYGGQRHEVKIRGKKNRAMFVTINDLDLIGACTIDPLSVIMFI